MNPPNSSYNIINSLSSKSSPYGHSLPESAKAVSKRFPEIEIQIKELQDEIRQIQERRSKPGLFDAVSQLFSNPSKDDEKLKTDKLEALQELQRGLDDKTIQTQDDIDTLRQRYPVVDKGTNISRTAKAFNSARLGLSKVIKLKDILEQSDELLYELTSYLDSGDLLNFSIINKNMRELFSSANYLSNRNHLPTLLNQVLWEFRKKGLWTKEEEVLTLLKIISYTGNPKAILHLKNYRNLTRSEEESLTRSEKEGESEENFI